MNERVRMHVSLLVGVLRSLDREEQIEVLGGAADQLGLVEEEETMHVNGEVTDQIERLELLEEVERGGHAVSIMPGEDGGLMMRNSWGKEWGATGVDEELEREIAEKREQLQALEAKHKERIKDLKVTPEEHLESSLQISNLRAEIRDLEGCR